jgi:hypothetical protein
MSIRAILLPLFVEVVLTFVLLIQTAILRRGGVASGAVEPARIALGEPNWPPRTMQFGNAFSNQFQLPVLFYVLTILVIVTRHADLLFVILAWLFVVFRMWHAAIHTTTNAVMLRGLVYGLGALVLMVMWLIFAVRILLGLP